MLEQKVLQYIKKYCLLKKGDRVLVGVSGGPDSLALLHYLDSLKDQLSIMVTAAHVDHMFRGRESYEDFLFTQSFCEKMNIPFEGKQIDVQEYINKTGKSSQVAARELRYAFYKEVMNRNDLNILALGHHGDDQIETILMRLTRGASGESRAGMAFSRPFHHGKLIRPFLGITKSDIMDYCSRQGLVPRHDPSNEKEIYARNRFRLNVLPFIKKENRNAHEHFQRFSDEIREDEAYLTQLAEERLENILIEKMPGKVIIDYNCLMAMPKPLQRRCIQLILNYLYFERPETLSAVHIEQLLEMFQNPHPSGEIHLPDGLTAEKSYDKCTFSFERHQSQPYSLLLQVPGETLLPNGYKIIAQYIKDEKTVVHTNWNLEIPSHLAKQPFIVRTRKMGDRMSVKGLSGTKKVKDIFINEKISLKERDSWPIVEDSEGTIIWIPGLKKSPVETHDLSGQSFIYLQYKKQ